jgi:hypothetical protein
MVRNIEEKPKNPKRKFKQINKYKKNKPILLSIKKNLHIKNLLNICNKTESELISEPIYPALCIEQNECLFCLYSCPAMRTLTLKNITYVVLSIFLVLLLSYYLIGVVSDSEQSRFKHQLALSRSFVVLYILFGLFVFIRNYEKFKGLRSTALPLAILRIVFFGVFFIGGLFEYQEMIRSLLFFEPLINSNNLPDQGSRLFWSNIPFSPHLIHAAFAAFIVAAFFSFIGYKTRISIIVFSILAIYLFAISNLSGKINHNQDIFWIPILLSFSGCGDILSTDAYLNKKKGKTLKGLQPSFKYSFAIFSFWLMLGICYFFPGFWKMWNTGLDWALTDNMQYQMYDSWNSLEHFIPVLRIDHYPLLYKACGIFILWFELSFLFLFSFKKTRAFGIISGILFHLGILIFMNIFFIFFLLTFLAFFNYDSIYKKWSTKAFDEDLNSNATSTKPMIFSTGILLAGFILFGILQMDSWPFTCYPRFDKIVKHYNASVIVEYCPLKDSCSCLDKKKLNEKYSPERLAYLEDQILYKPDKIETINEMKDLYINVYHLRNKGELRFLKNVQSINPDSSALKSISVIAAYDLSNNTGDLK